VKLIPHGLRELNQWCLWKSVVDDRGRPTKHPYQLNGELAKSNDPSTWVSFADAMASLTDDYSGIGFVFSEGDEFCGIDLDGCRNPETGEVAAWAKEVIMNLDTYAEVSPSETGVKLFVIGKNPFDTGKKKNLDVERVCDKEPAIEVYDKLRYFAVTGRRLRGPAEPMPRQEQLEWIKKKFWPEPVRQARKVDFQSASEVFERARKYLARVPGAVSGSGGHNATFRAACVLVLGFGLSQDEALRLLSEWNEKCQPPWTDRELLHKVTQADKQGGERNYMRNAHESRWDRIEVPAYTAPDPEAKEPEKQKPTVTATTLFDASLGTIEAIRTGKLNLESLGIKDIDRAIGGGVRQGEVIVIGARSGHCKSTIALQIVHHWTGEGKACLMISEEMSSMVLGQRTIQYASDVPEEHWKASLPQLESDIRSYAESRAQCIVVESCRSAAVAVEQIEKAHENHHIRLAVVDYAQLLHSPGSSSYEKVTNTCKALVDVARRTGITLVMLCQLNRTIENRGKFEPKMSDLKDSGQFEQDAELILFLVWPHKLDAKHPPHEIKVYIAKNRHRRTESHVVTCKFQPSRQTISSLTARDMDNYTPAFDDFNQELEF